ncbi:hypothetical protein [Kitasatospora azatica]|uniref:hypothetical protein n=1 Tax=Kitasatospora azatica TaxID=58347 RepID=UPI00068EC199|nr:hypothetical protein [Kitasatospora azatica]
MSGAAGGTPGATGSVRAAAAAVPVPGPRPGPPRPTAPRPGPPRPGARPGQIPKPGPRPAPAGPAVQLVPAQPGNALERADEAVDLLLEAGRNPGDILVLTADQPHPWQQHELSFGEERYWAQLAEGADVFYADLALTRPARRDVVVLVVDAADAGSAVLAAEKARTHAVSLLVVCGATGGLTGVPTLEGQPVPA